MAFLGLSSGLAKICQAATRASVFSCIKLVKSSSSPLAKIRQKIKRPAPNADSITQNMAASHGADGLAPLPTVRPIDVSTEIVKTRPTNPNQKAKNILENRDIEKRHVMNARPFFS
ncbi:MAG: hypothetical protein KGH91_01720 [Rhodospirillales bacterium]|nr:hypothetical protein [Rhodospirillales bacterium]